MQRDAMVLVAACLLVLASLPWLAQLTRARPLVPENLRQARVEYDSRVKTVQAATRVAERSAQSTITIRIVGTVERAERTATPVVAAATATLEEQPTPEPATQESTATLVVVAATATLEEQPTPEPATQESTATDTSVVDIQRLGMIDVTDILTEAMITTQIQQDMHDDSIQNLVIMLTPEEVRGTGVYVKQGVQKPLQVVGELAIENEGLVVRITSIKVGSLDVTADQRGGLESTLNSSIYRLLPERFVQSYQLEQGQVVVQSRKRK